ncbi:hypothetical protein K8P10_001396 [Leucobacter sp. Psy1]|nr:hypothetical protein K8P10_001396 [Leucobacter sp. Psy1]
MNTGARAHNIAEQLSIADGAIVGTTFKRDGILENEVAAERVTELISAAQEFRRIAKSPGDDEQPIITRRIARASPPPHRDPT